MPVLSDKDIVNAINNADIIIEPYLDKHLTPNGYDLSIDEIYIKKTDDTIKEGIAIVPPLT